jgi:30S ribosomal protein S31
LRLKRQIIFYVDIFGILNKLIKYTIQEAFMGRGDKRTTKGKIFKGSFGVKRPRKNKKTTEPKTA